MKPDLPTPEELRKLLRYDPDTGKLWWRERSPDMFKDDGISEFRRWNARYAEKQALSASDGHGYRRGAIFGQHYLAHRVAYALHYGKWPDEQIDHINGVRDDNRIVNLRAVSNAENSRNAALPINNNSGTIGVSWDRRRSKWAANIVANGEAIHLGRFLDKYDAITARIAAEKKYGFHENHGRN